MAYQKKFNLILVLLCTIFLFILGPFPGVKADSNKYPAISGTIHGQAISGVKSISVNGKPVRINADQSFRSFVQLKTGEKYLTLKINFDGLRLTKKYLILRRPQIKTFKVYVPKEEIQKPSELILPSYKPEKKILASLPRKQRSKKIKKIAVKKTIKKRSVAKRPIKIGTYLYVWEFDRGKLLLVKESKGDFSAEVVIPAQNRWIDFNDLTYEELKEIMHEI